MTAVELLRLFLLPLHALAGAAWFGSSFYYVFVLYPRSARHFDKVADRERFFLSLAQGARWQVVTAISLLAVSGIGLAVLPRERMTEAWLTLVGVKTALLIASTIFFWRVSWHWWPARLFALESELEAIHRRFRIAAFVMLAMVGLNMALGVVAKMV